MPSEFPYFTKAALALLAVMIAGSCSSPPKRLTTSEGRTCLAQGYESRSAFGFPICQFDYADAGKICTGKAGCQGDCRFSVDGSPSALSKPGDALKGLCQARSYEPGCYATIEDGKVTSEGAVCED
jgi:hypothetical protein